VSHFQIPILSSDRTLNYPPMPLISGKITVQPKKNKSCRRRPLIYSASGYLFFCGCSQAIGRSAAAPTTEMVDCPRTHDACHQGCAAHRTLHTYSPDKVVQVATILAASVDFPVGGGANLKISRAAPPLRRTLRRIRTNP
jgi:hypothetical protein